MTDNRVQRTEGIKLLVIRYWSDNQLKQPNQLNQPINDLNHQNHHNDLNA